MNHLRTRRARSSGVFPCDIAAKSSGRSHQYAVGQPTGYSEHDVSDRLWRTGKLCKGNGGENERGGGERGEIAREVCDPVEELRRHMKEERRY